MTTPREPDLRQVSELIEAVVAEEHAVLRRVKVFSGGAFLLFFLVLVARQNWSGLIGLTCSAMVVMINFLWLEDSVVSALQPASTVRVWKLALPTVARFTLFGLALSITLYVVRVNTVSVLLGFSVIVVGIMAEGVYSVFKAIRSGR